MMFTELQVQRITKILKKELKGKVFTRECSSHTFNYEIVPILSRKGDYEFSFKVRVLSVTKLVIARDERGRLRDDNGCYIYKTVQATPSKLLSHRFNYTLRHEVEKNSVISFFGLQFYHFKNYRNMKVEWVNAYRTKE